MAEEPLEKPDQKIYEKRAYQSDMLDLLRKVLDGVPVADLDKFDHLQGEEKMDFLKYCNMVVSNKYFVEIFEALYWPNIIHAATKAENYDVVSFNRATANGTSLAREFFERQARKFDEVTKNDGTGFESSEPFDPVQAQDFYKL